MLTSVACLAGAAALAGAASLDEIKELAAKGRTTRALNQLESFLVGQPDDLEGQFLRGVLLVEERRTADAERAFLILSQRFPERPEPINNLAVLRAASGKHATAITHLEQIVSHYPDYEVAARNLERIRSELSAGAGYDPMDPDATQVQLVLTAELGSYPRIEPQPEPAAVAAPVEPAVAEPEAIVADAPEPPSPQPGAVEAAMEPVAEPAVDPATPPAAETTAVVAHTEPAAETLAVEDLRTELTTAVAAWAQAWSAQRLREYLDCYAVDFDPTGFASREAWETVRRQRVATPSFIEVEIDFESMAIRQSSPGEARVTFTQSYRSDRFSDTVQKTLDLVREEGAWRIRRETSG